MAKLPGASLSQQMESWAQSKATYRFLDNAKASHEKLQRPHWAATRERAGKERVVLLVQDVTELDYTAYAETMVGLGPIGDGRGHGLLMHSTLAIVPGPRRVLGIAHQQVFKRVPNPDKKKRRQRPKKERESRVWGEAVQEIGPPPEGSRWVVVADRGADNTDFLLTCRETKSDFNVRMAHEHRLVTDDGDAAADPACDPLARRKDDAALDGSGVSGDGEGLQAHHGLQGPVGFGGGAEERRGGDQRNRSAQSIRNGEPRSRPFARRREDVGSASTCATSAAPALP